MKILMIWQSVFPWEVRVEKFADSFLALGHSVRLLSRKKGDATAREILATGLEVVRVGAQLQDRWNVPTSFNPIWRRALQDGGVCVLNTDGGHGRRRCRAHD